MADRIGSRITATARCWQTRNTPIFSLHSSNLKWYSATSRQAARFTAVSVLCLALAYFSGRNGDSVHAAPPVSGLVSIDLDHSSPPLRSDAPITFVWRVTSQSSSLIEGRLVVTIVDTYEKLAEVVLDDIVLTSGDQYFRTVLPPVEPVYSVNSVDVVVEFIGKNQKFGPWKLPVNTPRQPQRALAILLCDPGRARVSSDTQQLFARLPLDMMNGNATDKTLATRHASVSPEDLPADSLSFCGFDLVVLPHEGFSEVKENQLRALLEWVEAGGSLCVVPGEGALKEYHAQFLSRSVHALPDDPRFLLDPAGRLPFAGGKDAEAPAPVLCRHGLGRVALVLGKPGRLFAEREPDVRRMLAFLWKLRHDRLEAFLATGQFVVKKERVGDAGGPGEDDEEDDAATNAQIAAAQAQTRAQAQARYQGYQAAQFRHPDHPLSQLPLQSGDELLSRLMPTGLRVVPMFLIGLILILYVVLIGPADWFVLGAIKRRKWTWVTFPAVTIALTLATVWLAEWYMQVRGNRRTVTFHDVGEEGRIARRNRFDVLFEGSERFVMTDLTREIFTAMTLQRFSRGTWQSYQQAQLRSGDQSHNYTKLARYTGRVPARYSVAQFAAQWTPQLNRRFSIPLADEKPVEFDWKRFADSAVYTPATATDAGAPRTEIIKAVKQAFGESATVVVLAGGKRHHLAGNPVLFDNSSAPYGRDVYGNPLPQSPYAYPAGYDPNATPARSFLEDVSANSLGGLFAAVSQISPTGGKDFEDMSLLDPSDPGQWLLIIAVDRGDDLEFYRKLYTRGD